jgi:transcriptional regulator with XRE-family HTH domain
MLNAVQAYRERRISLGLTQEQAATAAGVSRRTLIDFETGGERISLRNLNRLLRAVGLELATRERSPRPTLDELADHYRGEEIQKPRQRARRKKAP